MARNRALFGVPATVVVAAAAFVVAIAGAAPPDKHHQGTATPIEHLIVIFQENVSVQLAPAVDPGLLPTRRSRAPTLPRASRSTWLVCSTFRTAISRR